MIMYEIFVWAAIGLMSAALIGIVAWLVWPLMFPRTPDLEGTTRRLTIPPMNDAAMVRTATDRAARQAAAAAARQAANPLWPKVCADSEWMRVQPLDSPWHPGRACLGPGCTHTTPGVHRRAYRGEHRGDSG